MNILSAIRKFFSSDLGKTIRNWMGGIGLFLMSLFTGEYTDTMTAFAIRSLMEGKATDARRISGSGIERTAPTVPWFCSGLWRKYRS